MKKPVKNWKELSRKTLIEKYGRGIEEVVFEMPDGSINDFCIKKEGEAVCVLPITKDKKVILAKQFRPGPKEMLLELPGGGKEKDETPEEAAARELLEEAGYRGNMELVTEVFDCGYSTIKRYALVATDCEKIAEQKLDQAEFIEIKLLDLDEFRRLLKSGKMTDVEVGYLGLDHLNLL